MKQSKDSLRFIDFLEIDTKYRYSIPLADYYYWQTSWTVGRFFDFSLQHLINLFVHDIPHPWFLWTVPLFNRFSPNRRIWCCIRPGIPSKSLKLGNSVSKENLSVDVTIIQESDGGR